MIRIKINERYYTLKDTGLTLKEVQERIDVYNRVTDLISKKTNYFEIANYNGGIYISYHESGKASVEEYISKKRMFEAIIGCELIFDEEDDNLIHF